MRDPRTTPSATISAVISTSGSQPRVTRALLHPRGRRRGTRARADDRLDDPPLPELVARDLLDDAPARHDDDAVAEARELERVAGLDDGGDSFVRLRAQCLVDVEARADVDALRGLLGEDDLDVSAQERADERHLLLVAAGERLNGLFRRRHADSQALDEPCDCAPLAAAQDDSAAGESPQDLDGRVRADAQDGEQCLAAPVAAEQDDSGAERSRRRARVELRAVAGCAADRGLDAGERSQERHLAVALGARNPEDLPFPDLQIDRTEALTPQARHREHDVCLLGKRGSLRERHGERPADHERDKRVLRDRCRLERPLPDAVAEHREAVRDREHLGKAVADVDDADSCPHLLEHECVEALDVLRPERRGGLVEEQHLRPGQQGFRDLQELSLGQGSEPVSGVTGMSRLNVASVSSAQLCMRPYDGRASAGTAR